MDGIAIKCSPTSNALLVYNPRNKKFYEPDSYRLDPYYFEKLIDEFQIICYSKDSAERKTKWSIALPKTMLKSTITWFHTVTGHPGSKKLRLTLEQRYYHPKMCRYIDNYKCADCKHHKLDDKVPERKLREQSFEEVAVDLIGPCKV